MNIDLKQENVAIKVKGMNHWLWFKSEKVTIEGFMFIGKDGWGDGGANTNIEVNTHLIEGYIESDRLQY